MRNGDPMRAPATPLELYRGERFWYLHELRRVRAMVRIGNTSDTNATRARQALQRELLKLRNGRQS